MLFMWNLEFRLKFRSDAIDTKFTTKAAGRYCKMVQVNCWAKEFQVNHPGFLQAALPFLACLLLLAQKNTWAYRAGIIIRSCWTTNGIYRAASAAIYSIIETCLANDIDPRDYFMYIFKHMPQEARLDDETVQKYLPWNTPMYLKDK